MKALYFRLAVLFVFVQPYCLRADVQLPAIISDHMVLTKSECVPIWGKADAGEKVTVALDGRTAETTAGQDGKWIARLNLKESGPGPFQLVVQGKNAITVSDVVIGSVWLAAGQSNMEFLLKTAAGAERNLAIRKPSAAPVPRAESRSPPAGGRLPWYVDSRGPRHGRRLYGGRLLFRSAIATDAQRAGGYRECFVGRDFLRGVDQHGCHQ